MTPRIGDLFPSEVRSDFSVTAIKPGTILRTHVDDTTPPKIKLFVVLAVNETQTSVATLYINSDVNPNMFHNEELKRLHLPISFVKYGFLSHDSFIDCSDLREKNLQKLQAIIQNDMDVLLGELSAEDLAYALSTVVHAKTISIKLKKKFGILL
jgi:hypothetical protein